jgi:ADP-ribose pyrophosphatase YjhB (NUDIX family)
MKYCNDCGALNTREWVSTDARQRSVCTSCGATHYENPRIIVCCIVSWREELLFCRRAQDPGKGQWTLPLGFLECGETLEEGAARETFEETAVRVDPAQLELSSIMNLTAMHQVVMSFRVALNEKPSVTAGPECLEAGFMSERQIAQAQLAWACMSAGDFFKLLRTQRQSIKILTLRTTGAPLLHVREYLLARRARTHKC